MLIMVSSSCWFRQTDPHETICANISNRPLASSTPLPNTALNAMIQMFGDDLGTERATTHERNCNPIVGMYRLKSLIGPSIQPSAYVDLQSPDKLSPPPRFSFPLATCLPFPAPHVLKPLKCLPFVGIDSCWVHHTF